MSTNPIVLVDVDGVLAQFNERFLSLLNTVNGGTNLGFPDGLHEPNQWSWFEAAGFPKKVVNAAWDFAQHHPEFWASLGVYPTTRPFLAALLEARNEGRITPYFCTSRTCPGVQDETHAWLRFYGFGRPNVVVVKTHTKHLVAQAVGATAVLDDYDGNFSEMPESIQCYLLDRLWNKDSENHDVRVNSPLQFLEQVTAPFTLRHFRPEAA